MGGEQGRAAERENTMKFVTQDYYQILNVSPEANGEDVKRAYRAVSQSFRPDSMAVHSLYSPEETEAISSKIDEAFQILSQPEPAANYRRYQRNGRSGMSVPRSPEVFFDEIHELDERSPIEALAAAVGTHEETPDLEEDTMDHEDGDFELSEGLPTHTESPIQHEESSAELLLSSLEEVQRPPAPTAQPQRGASPSSAWTPARTPKRSSQTSTPVRPASNDPRITAPSLKPVSPPISQAQHGSAARDLGLEAIANPFARPTTSPSAVQQRDFVALPIEELEAIEVDTQGINGLYLRRVREALGLDLFYIAAHTKIGRSMLGFIETDDADELPAQVYLKGYLLHISRLLKLPEAHTTQRYLSNLERR